MRTKISAGVFALTVTLVTFFGATFAWAATGTTPDDTALFDLLKPVIDAVKNGNIALAGALGVIFLVALTKRYLPDRFGGKVARGELGGMLTAFLYASATSVATALAAPGAALTSSVAWAALYFGLGAIGGFVVLHKLATALVATKWWANKAPAWLRSVVTLVLALIGSKAASQQAHKDAKAAGDAAVAAKPPTGMGEFTDVQ